MESTKRRVNVNPLLVHDYPGTQGKPLAFIKMRPCEMERNETVCPKKIRAKSTIGKGQV